MYERTFKLDQTVVINKSLRSNPHEHRTILRTSSLGKAQITAIILLKYSSHGREDSIPFENGESGRNPELLDTTYYTGLTRQRAAYRPAFQI